MFSVFRKLSWYFKEQWLRYLLAILALTIVNVIELFPPKLVGMAIDEIQYQTLTSGRLTELLLIFIGLIILSYGLSFFWDYTLFGRAILLERKMRSMLMSHFLKMTPRFFGQYRTGDLMARSTNDLKAIMMTSGFGILTLVDATIFMGFIILMMIFTINAKLTLAALIPLPFMAYIIHKYGKKIHNRFMSAQNSFSELNNYTLESIRGVRVTRSFGQERRDEQQFGDMTEDVYQKNLEVAKVDAFFEPTINVLVGFSYTIGIGYGALMVFDNQISFGDLVTFNVYLGMLIWPMIAVGELINVMQRGNASIDRVEDIFAKKPDVKDPENPKTVALPELIQFKQVSFRYPETEGLQLNHINLTITRGETIGIVGKTGAGKTTLLKQLLRQYEPPTGDVLINGIPIQQFTLDQTRQWMGYVPQDHILFSKTVRENLLYGCGPKDDDEIESILESVSLKEDIDNLPNGLETLVGESGVTLSGGQKQRVSLARALLMNPEILMLDDSLSAVDGKTEANIISHLKRERNEKTTFISAHRLSAVKHADQIIVLENGRIVERGTHDELISHGGWYKTQYTIQQMEEVDS
ncbi:ABC transporter ATP-binding protein [Salinibacillus xinjiangensis]|uniref:ATP-binding cassette domain-containing protein n=1 Tax=Salinibacillus xinjiangensis TaxID=1229268 RepID=A0A6G1X7R5_9BACI|nr:ABC transporter transmembrane domain-containing protein [Salinibacillus xinjiangensis]MRG86848.1 ATP-binding cassette domain-containing protein [Salinibacillus xinjiangensis]